MKRRQLVELHDLDWYPSLLRDAQIEVLTLGSRYSGLAEGLAGPFRDALERSEAEQVLDLCSGAGGPVVLLAEALDARGYAVPPVMLSDLYPNVAAWRRLRAANPDLIDFVEAPVDATSLPAELGGGLVTIINALHHFPEPVVRAVMVEITSRGSGLFIAEGFPRSLFRASAFLPPMAVGLAVNPFLTRRRRLSKVAVSFLFPVMPVLGMWDWFVSALRIHEPQELITIGREVAPHYEWTHGNAPFPPWGKGIYVTGIPR